MEMVTGLLGLLAGLVIGSRLPTRKGKEIGSGVPIREDETGEGLPPRLKVQFENFMSYDGTGRGQRDLEDR